MKRAFRSLAVFVFACAGLLGQSARSAESDLILILDASGSMNERIDKRAKLEIARATLLELIDVLPDDTRAALVAYGHRRGRGCEDIEAIVPPGPLDKEAMKTAARNIRAHGSTPLTNALLKSFELARAASAPTTIILLTDGLETCGGDPCQAARDAKASGLDFKLHVIGFSLEGLDASALECAATEGGGAFFDARSAEELSRSLRQAAAAPTSGVSVKVTVNGELAEANILVRNAAGEAVATGRATAKAEGNPAYLPLRAGSYRVEVQADGLEGQPRKVFETVAIADGERAELEAAFGSGQLVIEVQGDSGPADAQALVYRQGETQTHAHGRSGAQPLSFVLEPGSYTVVLRPVGIDGARDARLENVVIEGGKTERRRVDFSSGALSILVTSNGQLHDAAVLVYRQGESSATVHGRTQKTATGNPLTFRLAPGDYELAVAPANLFGPASPRIAARIEAGKTTETVAAFDTGELWVDLLRNGAPSEGSVLVYPAGGAQMLTHAQIAADPKSRPARFSLLAGRYDVLLRSSAIQGKTDVRLTQIEVKPGEPARVSHNYETGALTLRALRAGADIDANVQVVSAQTQQSVAYDRTYAKPLAWSLLPGDYLVRVAPIGLEGNPRKELPLAIVPGQTEELQAEF